MFSTPESREQRLHDAIDLAQVRRALVIKLRHHGDVLLTSPVFSVLKNHAPHVAIDALVYHDTQEMLTLHPAIDEVFGIDRAWRKQGQLHALGQEWRLFRMLRRRGYDLVIHLTENARGAMLARFLGARYSVAPDYARRGSLWRGGFTHLCKLPAGPRHTVERHLDALRRLGVYPGTDERGLTLVPGKDAEHVIDSLLASNGIGQRGFVHLHPTSRWMFKAWEPERYAELLHELHARGERVIVTSAPAESERAVVRDILARVPGSAAPIDLSGQLTLKQLAALTARARCFIGVDSVPMHIAAAVQKPVVALFGPSGEREWGPWQVRHAVVTTNHACRPCGLDGCGGSKYSECLLDISVDQVLQAFEEVTRA